jgi:hypothetical protein
MKKFADIEAEARAAIRTNGNSSIPGVYVRETTAKTTPERLIAESLEADPEAYAEYRAQHNSHQLLNALRDAGVKIG